MPNRNTDKPQDPKEPKPAEPDALEFELIDFDSARQKLDELPEGITARPGYWEAQRRSSDASDKALRGPTLDWVMSLPDAVRPKNLCEQYPRVANTIAGAWHSKERATVLIDRLMHDDRGGTRRGFPEPVMYDLGVLLHHRRKLP